jgi:uncharacterized protein
MVIGVLEIILWLPESHSLKDKRQVVKSLKDKVRNRFNVSVAEVGDQELWQKAHLGVCGLGSDHREVNGRIDQVVNFLERQQVAANLEFRLELIDY